jgi:peptide-methionine (S)-S-oxide reductase
MKNPLSSPYGKPGLITGLLSLALLLSAACIKKTPAKPDMDARMESRDEATAAVDKNARTETATFAMGCFWHSEEMFAELKGVIESTPGYSGGTEKNPSYEEVSMGNTRHAESVDITYDPAVITYEKLLQVFFTEHDPTTPDYAAPDEGPQYRSMIFYRNAGQKQKAENYIASLTAQKKYPHPIITEVVPFTAFYKAEAYHIHYYRLHPDQGYIASVTRPEIEKFRKDFKDWLK